MNENAKNNSRILLPLQEAHLAGRGIFEKEAARGNDARAENVQAKDAWIWQFS